MDPQSRRPARSWRDWLAGGLLVLGLSAMAGDVLGLAALKGLGLAWGFSPLPKVFSAVDGWETFAADFTLLYQLADGTEVRLPVTPEVYAGVRGPYNRRNVYGAALAYAPRLGAELVQPVFCFGLGPGGPLRPELGVPAEARGVKMLIESRTAGSNDSFLLEAPCTE